MSSLANKLAEVGLQIGYIQKDGVNTFHKYSYASAEAVLKKANKELFSRGIAVRSDSKLAFLSEDSSRAVVHTTLTFVDGETGETHSVNGLGQGSDKGDKAVMKANTAALKYALSGAFLISWGDDPEADATTDRAAASDGEEEAPAKRPSSRRTTKPKTADDIIVAISGAESVDALEKIRPSILALRDTPEYTPTVEAFKARKGELSQGAN
jgi:hypothetical protein